MFAKSAIISLALVAVAAPAMSAPVSHAVEARELETRLSLPTGALTDLLKSFGKGILSGGAVSGLLALLGEGSSSSSSTTTTSRREVEARTLASLLEDLVGAGGKSLESVIKDALIGGAASGVAVEGVNAAAGQSSKRSLPVSIIEDGAEAAEATISSVIGKGAADGLGSALGGLGIGAIVSKLFGSSSSSSSSSTSKRALSDLSDAEVNTLLEYINEMNNNGTLVAREPLSLPTSSIGKGIAGLVASLAATQGVESAINEVESLIKREVSFDELD